VKKRVQATTDDDKARWSRVARFLLGADPPFSVLPFGSDGDADYVLRIGLEARVLQDNSYFGSVPISRQWEGTVRATVRATRSNEIVHRFEPVTNRTTASARIDGGEEALAPAFDQFMKALGRVPGFGT
jgi:hypothetical protein